MLAEIGDDCARFADARALKAYAGSAPITRDLRTLNLHHPSPHQKQPVATAGWIWAFAAATNCPAARQTTGADENMVTTTALPPGHLFNKLLGQLYHCLQNRELLNEDRAFRRAITRLPPKSRQRLCARS